MSHMEPGDYLPLVSSSNQRPTAYIDYIIPMLAEEGETVSFVGYGVDIDGTIMAYDWESSIDGPLSSSASFDTFSLSVGAHVISFKVQDDDLAWSSSVTKTLTIYFTDIQPPTKVTNLTVEDAKNGKLHLSWDQATDNVKVENYNIYRDNEFLINTNTNLTIYNDTGLINGQSYMYNICAVDFSGNEGEKSDPISGTPTKTTSGGGGGGGGGSSGGSTNNNPIADASNGEPYQGDIGESITFDGSLSYDPDGDNITYIWDFGDGTTGSGILSAHSYFGSGNIYCYSDRGR